MRGLLVVGSADWGRDFLRYSVFFYVVAWIRTVSYIFTSVRCAGDTFGCRLKFPKHDIIESLFFGSLLWGSCRLWRLREGILRYSVFFDDVHLTAHFIFQIYIPPLRWGYFCRLKQKYPKVRFSVRRIWWTNFDLRGKIKISSTDAALAKFLITFTIIQKEKSACSTKPLVPIVLKQEFKTTIFFFSSCGF